MHSNHNSKIWPYKNLLLCCRWILTGNIQYTLNCKDKGWMRSRRKSSPLTKSLACCTSTRPWTMRSGKHLRLESTNAKDQHVVMPQNFKLFMCSVGGKDDFLIMRGFTWFDTFDVQKSWKHLWNILNFFSQNWKISVLSFLTLHPQCPCI